MVEAVPISVSGVRRTCEGNRRASYKHRRCPVAVVGNRMTAFDGVAGISPTNKRTGGCYWTGCCKNCHSICLGLRHPLTIHTMVDSAIDL